MESGQKTKIAALYARVSTINQREKTTVQNQLRELRSYAQRNGYTIYKEYVDDGYSGSSQDRPQLMRLLKDADDKLFDAVIVWKFDRFGRSTVHLINSLERFRELGIDFISLRENIDTGTSVGRVFFGMVALIAEFERESIKERILLGMKRRKEDGRNFGKKTFFDDFYRIYSLRAQGNSLRKIASEVGLSRTRISQLLKERDNIVDLLKQSKSIRQIAIELKIQEKRVRCIVDYLNKCPVTSSKVVLLIR